MKALIWIIVLEQPQTLILIPFPLLLEATSLSRMVQKRTTSQMCVQFLCRSNCAYRKLEFNFSVESFLFPVVKSADLEL